MAPPIATRLDAPLFAATPGQPLLLDGATGTELERRGVAGPAPLWSAAALLARPDVVEAIHRDYIAAGADVLVADTFRTNPRTLRAAGIDADGPRLNRLALDLARRAAADAGRHLWIAASVGPVADCYSPELTPSDAALRDEHGLMMAWLRTAAPDLVWIETMNTVREAAAAARAASEAGLPLACAFVVNEDGDLLSSEPLSAGVAAVEPYEPLAIGLNCIPPEGLTALLPRLRGLTRRPLSAYAHVGNARPIRGWSFTSDPSPVAYARHARRWIELGAAIVGGCCGTQPEHIRAIREEHI